MHLTKNYNTDGATATVIGSTLEFEQGAEVKNFLAAAVRATRLRTSLQARRLLWQG